MTGQVLQFILDMVSSVVSFEYLYMPIIVMAAFSLIFRLIRRRYS